MEMMAYDILSTDVNHDFEKLNKAIILSRNGEYDSLKCRKCGIKTKVFTLGYYRFNSNISLNRATICSKRPGIKYSKKIKITRCTAEGKEYGNLIPDSIHETIEPPKGEHNRGGWWVMGVGEPVKVLDKEYVYYE